eukprot:gene1476-865_t
MLNISYMDFNWKVSKVNLLPHHTNFHRGGVEPWLSEALQMNPRTTTYCLFIFFSQKERLINFSLCIWITASDSSPHRLAEPLFFYVFSFLLNSSFTFLLLFFLSYEIPKKLLIKTPFTDLAEAPTARSFSHLPTEKHHDYHLSSLHRGNKRSL